MLIFTSCSLTDPHYVMVLDDQARFAFQSQKRAKQTSGGNSMMPNCSEISGMTPHASKKMNEPVAIRLYSKARFSRIDSMYGCPWWPKEGKISSAFFNITSNNFFIIWLYQANFFILIEKSLRSPSRKVFSSFKIKSP